MSADRWAPNPCAGPHSLVASVPIKYVGLSLVWPKWCSAASPTPAEEASATYTGSRTHQRFVVCEAPIHSSNDAWSTDVSHAKARGFSPPEPSSPVALRSQEPDRCNHPSPLSRPQAISYPPHSHFQSASPRVTGRGKTALSSTRPECNCNKQLHIHDLTASCRVP